MCAFQSRKEGFVSALMTTSEVSAFLNVSDRTVENMRRRGQLPAIKLSNRCLRFRREDVLKLLGEAAKAR
jgi:excisionase family DNA binding protein